jgi:hypothetical protein
LVALHLAALGASLWRPQLSAGTLGDRTMYEYRVTKYDPSRRDREGRYLHDEWTAFSDVGNKVNFDVYDRVEQSYIDVALAFMSEARIPHLSVANLEHGPEISLPFVDRAELGAPELRTAFRLVLREACWCRFLHPSGAFVHFGYDYYMYIGTPGDCPQAKRMARERDLFVESFKSPYRELPIDEPQ